MKYYEALDIGIECVACLMNRTDIDDLSKKDLDTAFQVLQSKRYTLSKGKPNLPFEIRRKKQTPTEAE